MVSVALGRRIAQGMVRNAIATCNATVSLAFPLTAISDVSLLMNRLLLNQG